MHIFKIASSRPREFHDPEPTREIILHHLERLDSEFWDWWKEHGGELVLEQCRYSYDIDDVLRAYTSVELHIESDADAAIFRMTFSRFPLKK